MVDVVVVEIVFQLISLNRNFYFKHKRSFGGNFDFNTILASRNFKKRTVNSRSRAFAAVRMRSRAFATVRSRSQWFATVRSGSPPFAVDLKLNIRYSLNKIRETKKINSLFLFLN